MTYSEKLKDPRWQKRRLEILQAANWMCEDAGCKRHDSTLEVHHTYYFGRRDPWDYERSFLICLCSDCHQKRQQFETGIHVSLAKLLRNIPICRLEKMAWDLIQKGLTEELNG